MNGYLEEYKLLHQDIMDYAKKQHDLVVYTFTGVTAIFTIAFTAKNMDILFTSYLLLITIKCRHLFYHEMSIKIANYITTFLEPNLPNMNWERRAHLKPVRDSIATNSFKFSRLHYYLYSIIALTITLIIGYFHIFNTAQILFKISLPIASLLLTIIVFYFDNVLLKKSNKVAEYYKAGWETIKSCEKIKIRKLKSYKRP